MSQIRRIAQPPILAPNLLPELLQDMAGQIQKMFMNVAKAVIQKVFTVERWTGVHG